MNTSDTDEKSAGQKVPLESELKKTISLPTAVLSLDASDDGSLLYAACLDGGIYEIDVASESRNLIGQHESYASGVALLPESDTVISSGYDGLLKWHNRSDRRLVRETKAHKFWSWQMAMSPNGEWVGSATGQYLCGGYKYEPGTEQEPSIQVFNARSGELVRSLSHPPPALSIAFSPDNRYVAAGNLMGDVAVWDVASGDQLARWNTPAFTSWGIIKCHYYVGGIYGITFTPDSNELIVCGMGPMRDPMAGNGKQTWQRFAWREDPPRKVDEIHDGDHGGGLPESIVFHPGNSFFAMAGRLAQGKWNLGFFNSTDGSLIHSLDVKNRITRAVFSRDGSQLFLAIATGQSKKKDGKYADFGRIAAYDVQTNRA